MMYADKFNQKVSSYINIILQSAVKWKEVFINA